MTKKYESYRKIENAINAGVFRISDAEKLVQTKRILRKRATQLYWRSHGHLNCRHGSILYGDSCVTCEREKVEALAELARLEAIDAGDQK